jgi:hypothetical protein
VERRRKRGRQSKRWRDEVEEGLNVMGIKNRQVQNGRKRSDLS